MEYTVAELSYLAGLIDGEGCIHICDKKISKSKSRGIRKSFRPYRGKIRIYRGRVNFSTAVSISNTNFEVIYWLKEKFGGIINSQKKPGKPHWNLRKTWIMSPYDICKLLNYTLPYLIIKKQQAILMIQARKIIDSNTNRMEHSDENYNLLLQLASHIKLLNKKRLPPCCP